MVDFLDFGKGVEEAVGLGLVYEGTGVFKRLGHTFLDEMALNTFCLRGINRLSHGTLTGANRLLFTSNHGKLGIWLIHFRLMTERLSKIN